jgi:hypothetical protein
MPQFAGQLLSGIRSVPEDHMFDLARGSPRTSSQLPLMAE